MSRTAYLNAYLNDSSAPDVQPLKRRRIDQSNNQPNIQSVKQSSGVVIVDDEEFVRSESEDDQAEPAIAESIEDSNDNAPKSAGAGQWIEHPASDQSPSRSLDHSIVPSADLSPPRSRRIVHQSIDQSANQSEDLSPPRISRSQPNVNLLHQQTITQPMNNNDLSPPRSRRQPIIRQSNHAALYQPEQPLINQTNDRDLSPPRCRTINQSNIQPIKQECVEQLYNQTSPPRSRHSRFGPAVNSPAIQLSNQSINQSVSNSTNSFIVSADLSPPRSRRVPVNPSTINQSINQSTNDGDLSPVRPVKTEHPVSSNNQTIEQSVAPLPALRGLVAPSEFAKHSQAESDRVTQQSNYQSNQSVNQSSNQSNDQPNNKSNDQSINQSKKREWATGLVQQAEARRLAAQEMKQSNDRSITRTINDAELNQQLRQRSMKEDPMTALKSKSSTSSLNQSNNQTIDQSVERPMYKGSPWPNRFGILPGYRWDGIDRSNGFELRWFEQREKQTRKQQKQQADNMEDM